MLVLLNSMLIIYNNLKFKKMGKISYFVKKKIGKETHQFQVEGENLFDVVMTSKNLSFYDVDKCGCCGHEELSLGAHIAQKKYKYVTIKCNKCKASVNFGQQVENPEVFYISTREEGGRKVLDWKPFVAEQK